MVVKENKEAQKIKMREGLLKEHGNQPEGVPNGLRQKNLRNTTNTVQLDFNLEKRDKYY